VAQINVEEFYILYSAVGTMQFSLTVYEFTKINSCPCVVCAGKSQHVYECMLEAVLNACDNIGISADPSSITTDFEVAAMQAVHAKLGTDVRVHCCFFHLCQSTWRKVQELGFMQAYRNKEDVRLFW